MSSLQSVDVVSDDSGRLGDRRGTESAAANVRLVGFVLFSIVAIIHLVLFLFLDYSTTTRMLWLLSLPQFLLVPLAFYAVLRLGWLLSLALVFAASQSVIELVQLGARVSVFDSSIEHIVFVALGVIVTIATIALTVLVWGARTTDRALNNATTDDDLGEKAQAVISQESNTLRLAALFGFFGATAIILILLLFGDLSQLETWLTFLSAGHIVLAPLVAFVGTMSPSAALIIGLLAFVQLALDLAQLVIRVINFDTAVLLTFSIDGLRAGILLLINFAFLLVDVTYLMSAIGLYTAYNVEFRNRRVAEAQTLKGGAALSAIAYNQSDDGEDVYALQASNVRKRKPKKK